MKTFSASRIEEDDDILDDSFLDDPDVKILDDWITKTKNKEREYVENVGKSKKKKKKNSSFVFIPKSNYTAADFDEEDEIGLDEEEKKKRRKEKKKEKNKPEEKKKKLDKASEDFYEQRFSGSLEMYKNLMGEINSMTKEAKKYLKELKCQNTRSNSRSITDQFSNITTLLNTKMSAIDKINGVNKNISELELKKERELSKQKEASGENNLSDDYIIDKMFSKLSKENDDKIGVKKSKKRKKKEVDEELDLLINDFEDDDEIKFNENEVAFKYESRGVHVVLNRNPNTGRTFFSAIDDDGNELYDYPLPDRDVIGKLSYNDDYTVATDKLGTNYDVIPVV